jgi:acyl-CoA synthetase (AMP-forming)/AMP-acid ligase II
VSDDPDVLGRARERGQHAFALPRITTVDPCYERGSPRLRCEVAYLQLTSASTGEPRLVAVSNENVLTNIAAIRARLHGTPHESIVSWLPLWHDMGLVGCALFSAVNGYDLTLLRPFDFLKRPARWLRLLSERKGTLAPAPDFAYDYCATRIADHELEGTDLSLWRHAMIGAEPIRVGTVRRFAERFAKVGFRTGAFTPCYGLAEATLAVSMKPGQVPHAVAVQRVDARLGVPARISGRPEAADGIDTASPEGSVRCVSTGPAIDQVTISVLDASGNEMRDEGVVGEIAISGPSVALGYYHGSSRPIESWGSRLRTGDVGFVLDGEVYILDRLKNTLIRNGQNFFASSLEEQLAHALEVPSERVAIFDRDILAAEAEAVALIETDTKDIAALRSRWAADVVLGGDVAIPRALLVAKRSLPRTSSGKKRHAECRRLLTAGELDVLAVLGAPETRP